MSSKYGRHFGNKNSTFGADTNGHGHDLKVFGDTTGKYIWWDASANTFYVNGTLTLDGTFAADNIALIDSETLSFGTGSGGNADVVMQWDGTNFLISALTDDSLIEIGDSTATQKSFDVKWYGNENSGASYLYLDASANLIYTTDIDFQLKDNDKLVFGTGSGVTGDVQLYWDGSDFVIFPVGSPSNMYFGGSANLLNVIQYGNNSLRNVTNDANGNTLLCTKSRGATNTALQDNDIIYRVTASGYNDNATPVLKNVANLKMIMADVTDTTEDGAFIFEVMVAGTAAAEKLKIADKAYFSQALQIGIDGTGYDIQWFGDTPSSYILWDQTNDLMNTTGVDIKLVDNDYIVFGTGTDKTGDINFTFNGTQFVTASVPASLNWLIGAAGHVINITLTGTFTVGVDGTGHDVQFFGDTSGCSMLYDQSEDQLVLTGPADVPALKIVGQGSYCNFGTYTALGAAWADGGTPAFAADQGYMIIDLNGTLYRIPLFANT